jgi:hypothetical protein
MKLEPLRLRKKTKTTVGPHGFAIRVFPAVFLMLYEAWKGLASYPQGVQAIQ